MQFARFDNVFRAENPAILRRKRGDVKRCQATTKNRSFSPKKSPTREPGARDKFAGILGEISGFVATIR